LTLFPAARKSLDEEDWHAIEDIGLQGQADPLFDGEVDEQFSQLYRVITEEATSVHADPASGRGSRRNA
jgi:hypothetical protein